MSSSSEEKQQLVSTKEEVVLCAPASSLLSSSPKNGDGPQKGQHKRVPRHALPLSMQLMKPFAGLMMSCPDCGSHSWPPRHWVHTSLESEEEGEEDSHRLLNLHKKYDDVFAKSPHSPRPHAPSMSPMVVAPMMHNPSSTTQLEQLLCDYSTACNLYGCPMNAGVLTALRFSLPCLRATGEFHDVDMLALVEVLLQHGNTILSYIRRLDFSIASKEGRRRDQPKRGFRSHGALALAKVLQKSQYIQEVFLQRNPIGPFGASALFWAAAENKTLRRLHMRRCRLMEQGGLAFAEMIASNRECGLTDVDLSANYMGFRASVAIEQQLAKRDDTFEEVLVVDLEGNLVFQEIMNGVTHGLGVILAVVGAILMSNRVHGKPQKFVVSCAVYSTSVFVLYMSSTLYHSFFALQNTKYIFEVLDKCAIYILIAGSYTPFLQIVLGHNPLWSVWLLGFIWMCCFGGIYVEAFFPTWKHKPKFSLAMYLGMGWSCMVCMPEVVGLIPAGAVELLVLGGVGYTSGVPFFVRNNNLDHSIWHCFVLAGSMFHWFGIYIYIASRPPGDES